MSVYQVNGHHQDHLPLLVVGVHPGPLNLARSGLANLPLLTGRAGQIIPGTYFWANRLQNPTPASDAVLSSSKHSFIQMDLL